MTESRPRRDTFPFMHAMAQRTWATNEPLSLMELPTPEPRSGEVRVAVKAIGVNPVDWKMRSSGPIRLAARIVGPSLPFVPGIDFSGVIEAVGPGVTTVAVGQRVVGGTNFSRGQRGSYADMVIARPDQLFVLPDAVDLDVAGALPVAGVTALRSIVELGRIRQAREKRVLVLGASGGVGQIAVQVARNEGAFVAGVCSAKNVDLVQSLGANAVIDYTKGDALAQAAAHAPFQVVVDCVGGYKASQCRAMLTSGGRHVMVAGDSMGAASQVLVPPFKSKAILGKVTGALLQPLVEAIAAGRLKVNIAARFPLAEAEEAHKQSQSGRMAGKIILTV